MEFFEVEDEKRRKAKRRKGGAGNSHATHAPSHSHGGAAKTDDGSSDFDESEFEKF